MMHNVLIQIFPLVLIAFEALLRVMLKVDVSSFVGPTLATAGISFLVPLTKPLEQKTIDTGQRGMVTVSSFDLQLIAFVWMCVLVGLFAWALSCHFSLTAPDEQWFLGLPSHFCIGAGVYIVSLVMIYVKGRQSWKP